MKLYRTNLLGSNPTNVYDKEKTFYTGRFAQKTLPSPFNSTQVFGAPLTKFLDTFTDATGFLPGQMCLTSNNRLYVLMSLPVTGVANQIAMYNFDRDTGAYSYVGKIAFSVAAATIVVRGFKVDDSNASNVKIFIGHTSTSVTTGGLMMINKVAVSNFVPIGFSTFYTAITDDVSGVYNLQLPQEVGGATLMTALAGVSAPATWSTNGAINTKVFAHNGISATHQQVAFDYAAAPLMNSIGVSTATAVNTTGVSTTFTMTGNTLKVGDQVVIINAPPTAYNLTGAATAQSIYFVVATNFVSGSTFSLSGTAGGAIVNGSTAVISSFARALGQSTNLFVAKTANLPSLGAGTLLQSNSENYSKPTSAPLALVNQECIFMATTTNYILGKISELYSQQTGTLNATTTISGLTSTVGLSIGQTVFAGTSIPAGATIASIFDATTVIISAAATTSGSATVTFGAILWPSMQSINVSGSGLDYVTPTPINAGFDNRIDRIVSLVAGSVTLVKKWVNSMIEANSGSTGNGFMEAQSHVTDPVQLAAIGAIEMSDGWVFYASSATVGQRGIIAFNLGCDSQFGLSYLVSPVVATPGGQYLKSIESIEEMFDFTGSGVFSYRTSAAKTDAIFNTPTGGWVEVSVAKGLNILLNNFTQFRVDASVLALPASANVSVTTPLQVADIEFGTEQPSEISDYWDFSFKDSDDALPTRAGFIQRIVYASGTVPKLWFRAHDTNNNLVTQADSVTNIGNFEYSTDDGLTWNPLGVIPNVIGTRIRYNWTTPPGVDVRVSIRES